MLNKLEYRIFQNIITFQKISKNITMNAVNFKSLHTSCDPSAPYLIGICHMRSTNDKESNLNQVKEIVKISKEKNVKFLFLPECCDYVGENREETINLSEPLDGKLVKLYKKLAYENQMWLSLGGLHELILDSKGESTNKVYNCHVVINNSGDIVATYRKLHLFDVDTTEFKFRESTIVNKGNEIVEPIQTPIGNIGLQICYDVRFPETSVILRKLGAEILTYPSAFAYNTGKAHWEVLLRSRAIENQCYVIASAQTGYHNKKRRSYGHAIVVDPWGEIIAQCDNDKELDVSVAKIDHKNIIKVRQMMPCFDHRRDDIYTLHCNELLSSKLPFKENRYFAEHLIIADTIFYESRYCFCFTNIRCAVVGHVLVATKRKIARLNQLTPNEATDLFQTVLKVEKYLEKFYNATSMTVTVQDGEDAGQTVKHVHFHVMPRRKGDFEINDEIYIRLQKHDHNPEEAQRPLEEMIVEAKKYRDFIQNTKLHT